MCLRKHPLESDGKDHDGQAENTGLSTATSTNGHLTSSGGRRQRDGANGVAGDEGGAGTGRERSLDGGGGRGERELAGGGRHRLSSRDRDLRDGDLGGDGLGGAAVGDGGAILDTRLGDHSGDMDSGVGDRGNGGGTSDSEVVGDGVDASDDAGVLRDVRSADTLEEGNGLGDNVIGLTIGVQAGEGLLDELLVGAEAGNVKVVLALSDNVEPGVQALGDNLRARKLLLGLILLGGLRGISHHRNLRGLGRGGSDDRACDSLGDWADSGGQRDGLGDNDGGALLATTLGLLRATVSDGLDLSGEDSGGSVVGCGHDSSLGSW